MAKMFFLSSEDISKIFELNEKGTDGQYIVLSSKNGLSDIVQKCLDYDNVRIVTVPTNRLDKRLEVE